jgi:hypothetical protein
LPEIFTNVEFPVAVSVLTPGVVIIKPAVAETVPIAGVAFITPPLDRYPDVVKVVEPIVSDEEVRAMAPILLITDIKFST